MRSVRATVWLCIQKVDGGAWARQRVQNSSSLEENPEVRSPDTASKDFSVGFSDEKRRPTD